MNALVVYYSRTGMTKKLAEAISGGLGCDVEEIIDTKDRSGAKGYLIAGKDAMTKSMTEIKASLKDPAFYDIVIIGTPVWAFTMAPAVRTYLNKNKGRIKKTAFFCTQGGAGGKRAFKEMEDASGKKPQAVLEIREKEVLKGAYSPQVEKFIEELGK